MDICYFNTYHLVLKANTYSAVAKRFVLLPEAATKCWPGYFILHMNSSAECIGSLHRSLHLHISLTPIKKRVLPRIFFKSKLQELQNEGCKSRKFHFVPAPLGETTNFPVLAEDVYAFILWKYSELNYLNS
ncbi:hypothetical protein GOODEAATRI_008705 [Goodea atripinnis]|uniref:Maturase K n=1 Tax=Goodea atripinnis TaxID=208336 RepID=A0ABV0NSV2_9TELE